ncbi:hypothetical protein DY052_07410 [Apilactobacillus timberlakei]|uniref:hypothetical protein n=1 Tax=Apilactobacillus timberlakei TaxID=2008380 RepID=UPI00112B75A4|nr:hypothetical protein [Apilactobacillus timberlakei]TPR13680.1 hypothetical protein DY052_07410 [Apilactobacillus timberlakei]
MQPRQKLGLLGSSQRHSFVGTFQREGFKSYKDNYNDRTILSPTLVLRNIRLVDNNLDFVEINKTSPFVAQHLWINYGKQVAKLGKLHSGDKIYFKARVSKYTKFFNNRTNVDYQLERPTQLRKINNGYNGDLPLDDKNALLGYIIRKNKKLYFDKKDDKKENFYTMEYDKWRKNQRELKKAKIYQESLF